MAASKDKAILFARATVGKTPHLWPVAAFNTAADARSYAGMLKLAYQVGHQETIKALDPSAVRGEDGNAVPGTRWSVKVIPYAPSADLGIDDDDDRVSPPTS